MRLLPLLLLSCTEYDLKGEEGDPRAGRDPDGHDDPAVDTADDSGGEGEGDTTIPDDTDEPADVPEGKIDVVLVVDVAYVYDCYHADVALRTDELVTALFATGADVAVAIASYDDYQVDGEWFAAWGGLPYVLEQQLTTDQGRLQAAAAGLSLEWGGDGPGTGLEAIAQVIQGKGYDQDCDGGFDASTDVRPFDARAADVFGGGVGGTADSTVPGTGSGNGVGFRNGSTQVVVLFAENALRDRQENHEVPSGTCSATGSRSTAISALGTAGAKFLGVNAYEFQDMDPVLQEQLEDIADSTGSRIDADGDGVANETAVLSGDWDWPETSVLVSAIFDLAGP